MPYGWNHSQKKRFLWLCWNVVQRSHICLRITLSHKVYISCTSKNINNYARKNWVQLQMWRSCLGKITGALLFSINLLPQNLFSWHRDKQFFWDLKKCFLLKIILTFKELCKINGSNTRQISYISSDLA